MTTSESTVNHIAKQLAAIDGVLRDDIHVHESAVTTYIPTDRIDDTQQLDGVTVEVVEEHEHEFLISAEPADADT